MKRILIILFAVVVFISCRQPSGPVQVKIVTITDVHAVIFPFDFIRDTLMSGSLAHLKSYVDEQRAVDGQHIVLLDNGDILQGQPSGYYFNFISDREVNLFADVLNYLQFDASVVGNHDIETGPAIFNRLKDEFKFPWLGANVLDVATGKPYFPPYTMIVKDGVRIAVLGLITPGVPGWLPKKLWDGLEFSDMYLTAQLWMDHIRQNENPDLVIGLFHSGPGEATEYTEGVVEENAALMIARNVPGFDIIFTGHDHRVRNSMIENVAGEEVLMMAGQSHGRSVAVVDLVFEPVKGSRRFSIASRQGEIVPLDTYAPSGEFMMRYASEFDQVKEFISSPLGTLDRTIRSRDAFRGNSAFVDFIHQIQLNLTSADISMGAPLSFDATLNAGAITMRDMFRLYPFENYLYVMELTGEQIKGALEFSYGLWFDTMQNASDAIFLLNRDNNGNLQNDRNGRARFANPTYNFDSAMGIDYVVDVSKPAGSRITIERMSSGEPFDLNKIYRVAVNSYRGSGGGGHLTQGAGINHPELEKHIVWVSEKDLRTHIAEWIRGEGTLSPRPFNNWKIYPERWAEPALERDMGKVFPM
jgi:2',3'-cyclic-nucleotide 2'-phosphodiesterase / 3'-nucleotidase